MKTKPFITFVLFGFISCSSNSKQQSSDSVKSSDKDSQTVKLDTIAPVSDASSHDDTPTQEDERKKIVESYNTIQKIDSTFINGIDTLRLHLKYFCLKDSNLVIPKLYDQNGKMEFKTHPFATDIILLHNRDTVLNKRFTLSDFTPFYQDNWGNTSKKYGSILDLPRFSHKNNDRRKIVLFYSIAIPSTDLGLGMSLTLNKKGDYTIAKIQ